MIDRRHDLDRLRPMLRACPLLGWLVAHELMDEAEAIAALHETAEAAQPRSDASGWRAALAWALRDRVAVSASAASRAERDVRQALGPHLAGRAPSATLFAVAERAHGGELPPARCRDLVMQEMHKALRQRRVADRRAAFAARAEARREAADGR